MKAHQIFLTHNKKIPKDLPESFIKCSESFKKAYTELDYHLYDGNEIEDVIENNFDKNVFLAYNKLIPLSFKCDLARICLLYLYGGIYSDLFLFHMSKLNLVELQKYDICAFRDKQTIDVEPSNAWPIQNCLIIARKESPILKNYIDIIVENCKNNYYGENALDITGPLVLGKAIYKTASNDYYFKNNIALLGEFINLTSSHREKNPALITNLGSIIALRKKPKYDAFCDLDGNDYNKFYIEKKVYDESVKI